jgi:hypothetical protein
MGVDYSATVGWGLVVDEIPSSISPDKYVDEWDVQKWLEGRYEHIVFRQCGDLMNGEYVNLFALRDTVKTLDYRLEEGYISFDDPGLTAESGFEFRKLCGFLEVPWPDALSWKLIFNVS